MWENKEFKVQLRENSMHEYEKIMLSSGQCELFMPMGFMGDGDGETAWYNCSGFAPLSTYSIEKTTDALYLLERTLVILGRSIEYYIAPARVTLTTSTVFYNKDTGQVKIAYVPAATTNGNLRRNLVAFIGQLKEDIKDGKDEYLTEVARYIFYKNYYIKDIINKIAMFKRKIYEMEHPAGSKTS